MLSNAASNAFQRVAFALIDYYLEEEAELRKKAEETGMDSSTLETKLDELWGHVTLYNCYQFFTELTSKKSENPVTVFSKARKAGKFSDLSDDEINAKSDEAEMRSDKLWNKKPDADLMTLYFNATSQLPSNQIRTLAGNANKALASMAGAEKMMSSVYGIAITALVRLVQNVNSILANCNILVTGNLMI